MLEIRGPFDADAAEVFLEPISPVAWLSPLVDTAMLLLQTFGESGEATGLDIFLAAEALKWAGCFFCAPDLHGGLVVTDDEYFEDWDTRGPAPDSFLLGLFHERCISSTTPR